jgi:DNA invertase Pin-like site-specific DNA recombinase
MKIGYARVSSKGDRQKLDLQLDALNKAGCQKIYTEKVSGKSNSRTEFNKMMEHLREGDELYIYKLDRLSRSTKELLQTAEHLNKNNIQLISIQDKIDTTTAMGRFFFTVMASIAELELETTRERINSGLEAARARGKFGGAPKADKKKIERAMKLHQSGLYSVMEICDMVKIGRTTFYRYLQEENEKEEQRIDKIREEEAKEA